MPKVFSVIITSLVTLGLFTGMAASQTPESRTSNILNIPAAGIDPPAIPFGFEHVAIAADAPVFPVLQLSAHLDKSVYKPGEPILLHATLANTSSEQVPLGGGAFDGSQFNIIVRDEKSRVLPLLAYGEQWLAIPQSVYWNPTLTLNSGQTREYEFPLSRMYDMRKSGTYSVIVKRQVVVMKRSPQVINAFLVVNYQVVSKPVTMNVAAPAATNGAGAGVQP